MKNKLIKNVLKEELQCSMGCTEPSALAFAIAYSKEQLKEKVNKINVKLSSNMLKNALCVNIPNTSLSGIELIILLGVQSCKSENKLTILKDVSLSDLNNIENLKNNLDINVELIEDVNPLYIDVELFSDNHTVNTIIEGNHEKIKASYIDGTQIYYDELIEENSQRLNDVTYENILYFVNNKCYSNSPKSFAHYSLLCMLCYIP